MNTDIMTLASELRGKIYEAERAGELKSPKCDAMWWAANLIVKAAMGDGDCRQSIACLKKFLAELEAA